MSIVQDFYSKLGWRLDADFAVGDHFRVVQFTPPGSPSLDPLRQGVNVGRARLGTGAFPRRFRHRGVARRTRRPRRRRGRDLPRRWSGQPHISGPGSRTAQLLLVRRVQGPGRQQLAVQEVTARFPGRVDATETTFTSAADLASALRRAGPRTASTRSGPAGDMMQTGRTGTPSTWWRNKPARRCRNKFADDVTVTGAHPR